MLAVELGPVEADRAAIRRVHAGDGLHQGRLAGAVVADQTDDLPRLDAESDPAQGLDRPEVLPDVVELEQAHRSLRVRFIWSSQTASTSTVPMAIC